MNLIGESSLENTEGNTCEKNDNPVQNILIGLLGDEEQNRSLTTLETARKYILGAVSEITENVLLSSAAAVLPTILDALNVNCVINVAAELPDSPLHNESVLYCKINVQDNAATNLATYFDDASDLIHSIATSGGKTLVHCVAGVSRSASIVIAYLMKYHQLTLLEAYNHVKQKRSSIRPNCGFFKQLIEYEYTLFGCNTVSLVHNEYLKMDIPDVYDAEYAYLNNYRKKFRHTMRRLDRKQASL